MDGDEDEVGRTDEGEEEGHPAHGVAPAGMGVLQVMVGTREDGEA